MMRQFRWQTVLGWWNLPVSEKWHALLGHTGFLLLLVGSQVYLRERMLHFDSANYLFNLLWFDTYYIEHHRLVNVLTQWPVLQAIEGGWGLEAVMRLYSLVLGLGGYLCFLVVVYLFRTSRGGLLVLLFSVLTIRFKYYAPVSELAQSLPMVGMALGWLLRPADRWPMASAWNALVFALLAVPLWITHPFSLVSLIIGYLIWWWGTEARKDRTYIFLPLAMLGLAMLARLFVVGGLSGYEAGRLQILSEYVGQLGELPGLYIWDRFWWYLSAHYPLTMGLFLVFLFVLLAQKRVSLAIGGVLGFVIIALLAMLTHAYLDSPIYLMIDGYLGHLGIPLGLVFMLALRQKTLRYQIVVLALLVGFSLHRIQGVHTFYEKREKILRGIMDQHGSDLQPKLLAHMDAWEWDRLWIPWAIGMETLLMSALDNTDNPRTLYFEEYDRSVGYTLSEPGHYLGMHMRPERFLFQERPRFFINLSSAPYHRIEVKGAY